MRWHDLLFVHWPVPADALRRLLPAGVEQDVFGGSAWVGLVPFTMTRVRPLGLPFPTAHAFHECNVRTYVTVGGVPGVWFFSLDAASRLAVHGARLSWGLPYFHSRITLARDGGRIDYSVRRRGNAAARCDLSWEVGQPMPPATPESLEWFLTERYCLYVPRRRGGLCRGRIWHPRWSLREAKLLELEDSLVAAAGIEVKGPPASMFAAEGAMDVAAWYLERC
jgi:hypothetical protein